MNWLFLIILGQSFAATTIQTPLQETKVSSAYGMREHPIRKRSIFHQGVDLAGKKGSPIHAVSGGTVIFASRFGGYGNLIVVRHTDRLTTHYGHCDEIGVRVGQKVYSGDVLGTVGDTGAVTGPHLHFEIRFDGRPQEPMGIIQR